jgi:hypothetical protein
MAVFDKTPCGQGMTRDPKTPVKNASKKPTKSFEEFRDEVLHSDSDPNLEQLRRHREGIRGGRRA